MLECLAAVHQQNRYVVTVGRDQGGVAVHIHLLELERHVAPHPVHDHAHLVTEMAIGPTVQNEAHHVVDTLRHLKYRPGLGAASPSCLPIMNYAVIRTGGKQYRVSPGATLRIERLDGDVGAFVEFAEVLLAGSDETESPVHIGTPLVEGAVVRGQIVAQGRDRKILVYKKKRRKNYRRRRGHRQSITTVRVTEIVHGAA